MLTIVVKRTRSSILKKSVKYKLFKKETTKLDSNFNLIYFKQNLAHSKDFRVVDMTFLNGHLYCGINNGIVLVLKRLTLTPLLIFHAHMHQLHSLCPITFETYTKRRFNLSQNKRDGVNNSNKVVKRTQHMLLSLGRALAPLHEDIYLSSNKYRVDALRKYASCLIICAWNSN